jgi:hypothetical protein
VEHADEIGPDLALPFRGGDIRRGRVGLLDASVVEGEVQPTECLDRPGNGRLHLALLRDVAAEGDSAPAFANATAVARPMPVPAPVTK